MELLPANTSADLPAVLLGCISPSLRAESIILEYESHFAAAIGEGKASSFAAGRVALAAILNALDVGIGDEVIVPGYTCVAVPNPILFCGAVPIYADIDPETLNLQVHSVEFNISSRTKAIVVQHTFGYPAPLKELLEVARRHGLRVIEDCTHALGATTNGRVVGSYGDASFFSSEQTKIISTGAGGMAYSCDPTVSRRIAEFQRRCAWPKSSVIRKMMAYLAYTIVLRQPDIAQNLEHVDYYLERLGLMAGPVTTEAEMNCDRPANFEVRLSGAQARVGLVQLGKLQSNIGRRRQIASAYFNSLRGTRVGCFYPLSGAEPAYVRFPILVKDKVGFARTLREHCIQAGLWFTAPIHPEGVPQERAGYRYGTCPNAEAAVASVANLPCHPRMSDADARRVIDVVLQCEHA